MHGDGDSLTNIPSKVKGRRWLPILQKSPPTSWAEPVCSRLFRLLDACFPSLFFFLLAVI